MHFLCSEPFALYYIYSLNEELLCVRVNVGDKVKV